MPYGLKDTELARLKALFSMNEHIERVILYGSRAKGNYKPFSDVDITLVGGLLTHNDLSRIIIAIDDLLLPYQFDISIFHQLKNETLIDHINRRGIVIYDKSMVIYTDLKSEMPSFEDNERELSGSNNKKQAVIKYT